MLPASSRPTSLPKRLVNSEVPHVAPFHQVKVFDQKPMRAAFAAFAGGALALLLAGIVTGLVRTGRLP